jgi:hypothetical protein
MTTIRAKVTQNGKTLAQVTPQQNVLVSTYKINGNVSNLGDLVDVDTDAATDGSLLSYNTATQKWEAVTKIEKPAVEVNGGFF